MRCQGLGPRFALWDGLKCGTSVAHRRRNRSPGGRRCPSSSRARNAAALLTLPLLLTACAAARRRIRRRRRPAEARRHAAARHLLRARLRRPAADRHERVHQRRPPAGRLAHRPGPEDRRDQAVAGREVGDQPRFDGVHLPPARRRDVLRRQPGRRRGGQDQLRRHQGPRHQGPARLRLPRRVQGVDGRRPADRADRVLRAQRPVPAGQLDDVARRPRARGVQEDARTALPGQRPDRLRAVRLREPEAEPGDRPGQAQGLRLGLVAVQAPG